MADNFLEKHYLEYQAKKKAWLKKKKRIRHIISANLKQNSTPPNKL